MQMQRVNSRSSGIKSDFGIQCVEKIILLTLTVTETKYYEYSSHP